MNTTARHTLLTIALAALSAGTWAQVSSAPAAKASTPAAAAASAPMAEAEVKKLDRDAKKVTLKHGPIANLDMPGMTMVFQVRDPALLDRLVVGQKIKFSAQQLQGAYVVTAVEAPAPATNSGAAAAATILDTATKPNAK